MNNQLSQLDLGNNTELETLHFSGNSLCCIDLSNLSKFKDDSTPEGWISGRFKVNSGSRTIPVSSLSKYGFDPSKVLQWKGLTHNRNDNTITIDDPDGSYRYDAGNGMSYWFGFDLVSGTEEEFNDNSTIVSAVFSGTDINVSYLTSTGVSASANIPAAEVTSAMVEIMNPRNCASLVNYLFGSSHESEIILTEGQLAAIRRVL